MICIHEYINLYDVKRLTGVSAQRSTQLRGVTFLPDTRREVYESAHFKS